MATGSRSLTLKLIADIDEFTKGLNKGETQVQTFGDKVSDFGKKMGAAFAVAAAAAAAYATKLAIDGVKAAIEDEAAQVRLADSLKATTGATNEQIAAIEEQILQTSLATGVADDELRPALQRLAISTGDVSDAQKLMNLALDVAQSTGKPLQSVVNGISKAYDGSNAALGKLGIGLSAAELKTMSFQDVQTKLSDLFGGAAARNAETFQGRMARLQVAFDEAKESLGTALLPAIERFIGFLNDTGIPTLNAFIAGLTGDTGLNNSLNETQRSAQSFGKAIGVVSGIISGFITFLREAIGLVVSLANELIRAVNIIPGVNIGSLPNPAPSASRSSVPTVPKGSSNFSYGAGNPQYNITVNAIDGEGAARAVAKVVNESAARSVPLFTGNGIRLQ